MRYEASQGINTLVILFSCISAIMAGTSFISDITRNDFAAYSFQMLALGISISFFIGSLWQKPRILVGQILQVYISPSVSFFIGLLFLSLFSVSFALSLGSKALSEEGGYAAASFDTVQNWQEGLNLVAQSAHRAAAACEQMNIDKGTLDVHFAHASVSYKAAMNEKLWTNPVVTNSSERNMKDVNITIQAINGKKILKKFNTNMGVITRMNSLSLVHEMPYNTKNILTCYSFRDTESNKFYRKTLLSKVRIKGDDANIFDEEVTPLKEIKKNERCK